MSPHLKRHVAAYWRQSLHLTFDGSTPEDIYSLLGQAERLIAVLVAAVAAIEQEAAEREVQP